MDVDHEVTKVTAVPRVKVADLVLLDHRVKMHRSPVLHLVRKVSKVTQATRGKNSFSKTSTMNEALCFFFGSL